MTDLAARPPAPTSAPPAPTPGGRTDGWAALAATLEGELVRPADPGWDDARRAWNLSVDQHPAAVVAVASAADVAATLTTARGLGLRVAPQSTGHNAGPLGDLHDTVLLRTHRLRDVDVDPVARTVRVGGGAMWGDVTPVAAAHGLAALAGSAADVGVAGYTLGGGLSWLARSHGLASGSVLALEVVTADGRVRRVDADHDADLFWALRGGGGGFGVVTALELRLYPVTDLVAGALFFPLERAEEVLQAWRAWVATVPDTVTSVGRMLRFPPLPELPPALAGRGWVLVEAACQLPLAAAADLLAPLRDLGPELDTVAEVPVTALADLHMDPPGPVPGRGDGALVGPLPPEAVTALVRAAGPGVDSPLLSVELRHLGGALTPGRTPGGALAGLDAEFALFAVGVTPTPESVAAVDRAVRACRYALAPWTRGCYLNFAEMATAGDALWGPEVHAQLRRVKARYDGGDLVRANHPVRPAAG
ncbi:FAD-binding oxidoreductase [Phycicoccus flavus]|uniref:FAD-binding protein n=1 Tax=Phycicoccus flavus TaxID=2502783 RepID=A0A8T6QZF7_9MICO|nr:FAD-binding protein [Phycicoccus flavus]NHA66743.1 FAD-binding protein [Phycicoccus flavus]